MKLNDIEFLRLLPQFMRDDEAVRGLSAAIDEIVPGLSDSLSVLSTWNEVDRLTEAELDALAWELNILWYDTGADIVIKRELIKNSDMVFKKLGTKWAVENVIDTYFGEGEVQEWWKYNGEPGHFNILSPNPSVNNEKLSEFLNILSKIKRASAKLDAIIISLSGSLNLRAGVAFHETSAEQYSIGAKL